MQDRASSSIPTGWSGDNQYFRFAEHHGLANGDLSETIDVLRGRLLGAIYRQAVSRSTCHRIVEELRASVDRSARGPEIPGDYVGESHYLKTTEEYLAKVNAADAAFNKIVCGSDDPLARFWTKLRACLRDEGASYRVAQHGRRTAGRGLIRSLRGSLGYTLPAHEDISQCSDPRQAGFEIQYVRNFEIAALNICIESGSGGGDLVVWNIRPDEACKRSLGISYSGYPYPLAVLRSIPRLDVHIDVGDIYVFNASHVHAVNSIASGSRRTTIAALFGFIDPATIVSWT